MLSRLPSAAPQQSFTRLRPRSRFNRTLVRSRSSPEAEGNATPAPGVTAAGGAAPLQPRAAAFETSALLSATLDEEAAMGMVEGPNGRSWGTIEPRTKAYRALTHVNESTKWVVSALVFVVLLAAHNEWAAWAVVGAVLSSFLCKVLKKVINEQRPVNARKKDPGMPSSHSNSLNFLSVYAALSLGHHASAHAIAAPLGLATVAVGLFLTWLRVALGFHTWPQVIVGGLLGASTAAAWFSWGVSSAVPALRAWPPGLPLLYGATLLGMVAFAARNVLSWYQERKEMQQQRGKGGGGGGSWTPAPAAG